MSRTSCLLLALLLLASIPGCGTRPRVERTMGEDPIEGGETYSQSVSFEADDAEAALRDAAALVRQREFGPAIIIHQRLYRDQAQPESIRARALLRWAEAEGHLLNPDRNVDAAIARVELMLEEFPDSELRFEAEDTLERLGSFRETDPR